MGLGYASSISWSVPESLALVSYLSIELLVAQVTTIYGDKMMRLDVDMMSS